MRYKPGQKEETYQRIVKAAERSFKDNGYDGIGVDGLAKNAGVTSGAFYGHFKSKKSAFKAAIIAGLQDLKIGIKEFRQRPQKNWWPDFAQFYTSEKRTCDLSESCALQSLVAEVSRSPTDVKQVFEQHLLEVLQESGGDDKRQEIWANLALLTGAVTLARAVDDERLAHEISTAALDEIRKKSNAD